MSDDRQALPHFLRVVRSIANVRGPTVPLAAVFTTVVASAGCGPACNGFCGAVGALGAGGEGTTLQTGTTGMTGTGFMYDGGPVGDMSMPDGGDDAGDEDAGGGDGGGDDAGDAGKHTGVGWMPDGGADGGP